MQPATQLYNDGIITAEQLAAIEKSESEKLFSVHWELRTILYLGILLLTSGIGILIYLNIDTIGHQAVLALIAAGCTGCFYYAHKNALPYSNTAVKHPSPFFDYVVLLGCLLLGIFTGYLQFQYSVFGLHYGLATLFPTLVFFFCAYFFDHKGVLSLGITGLAAWAGLTVTPLELLDHNDFSDTTLMFTGMALGALMAGFAKFSEIKNIKSHFCFTWNNFAANILFVATLAAFFDQQLKWLGFLLLAGTCFYYIRYALQLQSFFFLLVSCLYGYIGLTYIIFSTLLDGYGDTVIILGSFYFMASCGGIILFFIKYKQILGLKR